ncbi:MAG TPA: cation:proton antiporter [Pirellulales bacterium]|nr:cation:proton antiporter [Pirellulales bacterium]
MHNSLLQLACIIVLGVVAQWSAWRLRVPSILLLLGLGIIAGPLTGFLQPDRLLGQLLLPVVSLSVAVILFEGGLSLKLRELRTVGGVVLRLMTVGVLATGTITILSAHYLLALPWPLAAVLGAILVVTGPTVIGPLLRHLRLGGQAGSILKWEGIAIDPIGAMLAVLIFAAVRAGGVSEAAGALLKGFLLTALIGGGLGAGATLAFLIPLRRYWVPDSLQNPVALAALFAVFTLANLLQPEAGLLAVTVMGIGLANQKHVTIKHLVEFKENLSLLLVSCLFLILAARLRIADLRGVGLRSVAFLAVLILVARPAAVFVSTVRSGLSWRERLFLSAMAPRGIVAASVVSVFALELNAAGFPQADRMVPITFFVIIGTVLLYGLSAAPLAKLLKLAEPNPQGVLLVGANPLARAMAQTLQSDGIPALLVDSDWANISAARQAGLQTFFGSILAEHTINQIDFGNLGHLLALTENDEVNSLACLRFIEIFGRRGVFQLPFAQSVQGRREAVSLDQRGRLLFGDGLTYLHLAERFGDDPIGRATHLTKEFDFDEFTKLHGDELVPMLVVNQAGEVIPLTIVDPPKPQPGDTVISVGVAAKAIAPRCEPEPTS